MDKDLFKKQYYEQQMFNDLRDTPFDTLRYIKKTYPDYDTKYGVDYFQVYRRIMNYRIKRYGTSYMPTHKARNKRGNVYE